MPEPNSGCWLWLGCLWDKSGYGRIYDYQLKRGEGAHRASWMIHRGPIPDGLWVLHKCDNRLCVNPDHLFLGTRKDNFDDSVAKKRNGIARRGEPNLHVRRGFIGPLRKLSDQQIVSVFNDQRCYAEIAADFHVAISTISQIKTGYNHSSLTEKSYHPRQRQTVCGVGHELVGKNLGESKGGRRYCAECNRQRVRKWKKDRALLLRQRRA